MHSRALLLLLALTACGPARDDGEAAVHDWSGVRPPDVVLVLLDTLRADALSCYGHPEVAAPYLAQLASRSTLFHRAYAPSTWTAPSSASVLTGLYPDRHGVTRGFLAHFSEEEVEVAEQDVESIELLAIADGVSTVAERFRDLGCATHAIVAIVNIGPEMGFERGFDHFERLSQAPANIIRQALLARREQMEAEGRPVFLYLHFNDVHEPYELRPRFFTKADDPEDLAQFYYARYQSELGYMDAFLGRLHAEMEWNHDTLLVVIADHGEEFGDHGQFSHQFTLYNELSQVPFLVFGPGLGVRPGRVEENVCLVDVVPTLIDLLGIDPPRDVDGRSLASLCRMDDKQTGHDRERQDLNQRPLILHRFEEGQHLWGVILGRWKLILSPDGESVELYDLHTDRRETRDLAPEEPKRCERLLEILEEHIEREGKANSARSNVEIDEDLMRLLKGMGYVK